jgi:hypothetical protein
MGQAVTRDPFKGSPYFWATCPRPDCGARNEAANRHCSECGYALYPSRRLLRSVLRDYAKP